METRDKAFTLYKKGMGCTEIAKKLGISLNTVKSWKKRYWDAQKLSLIHISEPTRPY